MFTPEERHHLRSGLLERAIRDQRISGVAITGSAAYSREDRWSDIDLAFGVRDAVELPSVLSDWTAHLYEQQHGRGMDQLPKEVTAPFEGSLVRQLDPAELSRCFRVAMEGLLTEMRCADEELAGRLQAALTLLINTPV